jgi:hypothetical protein
MTQAFRTSHLDDAELEKLAELRAKTDRQLHCLVHSRLDVGLSFAVLAEVEESAGDRLYAGRSLERAGQALAEAQKLLPALNEAQRRAFDPKLTKLREAVDRLERRCASGMTHTASTL